MSAVKEEPKAYRKLNFSYLVLQNVMYKIKVFMLNISSVETSLYKLRINIQKNNKWD